MSNKKKSKASADGKYHIANFFKNWLHQAITYMDRGERTVRILAEVIAILAVWAALRAVVPPAYGSGVLLAAAALVIHTLNWLFNGYFWALYLFAIPGATNRGERNTVAYLNEMAKRLEKHASIGGLALYGSVSRGAWHESSDIDVRIVRRPGAFMLLAAAALSARERFYAFMNRQPLDLFLADDTAFLRKMRKDETPLFLIKRDHRLENEFPEAVPITLSRLSEERG